MRPTYMHAARYANEREALNAYLDARAAILSASGNLSVFRCIIVGRPCVVILGDTPSDATRAQLDAALATGENLTVPANIAEALTSRRATTGRGISAGWVEQHHGAGTPLPLKEEHHA